MKGALVAFFAGALVLTIAVLAVGVVCFIGTQVFKLTGNFALGILAATFLGGGIVGILHYVTGDK